MQHHNHWANQCPTPLRIALLCVCTLCALAGSTYELEFAPNMIEKRTRGPYDIITYAHAYNNIGTPGEPSLPYVSIRIAVPGNVATAQVAVEHIEWRAVPGTFLPMPVQPHVPLSGRADEFIEPDPQIYSRRAHFPETPLVNQCIGSCGGFTIVEVLVSPCRCVPTTRTLEIASRMTLRLTYTTRGSTRPRTFWQNQAFEPFIRGLVINPDEVSACAPPIRTVGTGSSYLPAGDYQAVYITSDAIVPHVQPIVSWRTKQGIPCTTVTVSDIASTYSGWDTPEKIRNFIKDADTTWGTLYFVLAGDNDDVPTRYIASNAGQDSAIACDHYYIDLDSTWDSDGDHSYGEFYDDFVDGYSDVFVGRISVETEDEVNVIVNKLLTYEKNPASGYLTKCLLPAAMLWRAYDYWGDYVNDSIANCTPAGWQDSKLYESIGNVSHQITLDSINAGFGFVHFAGHGNWNGIYWEGGVDTFIHNLDVPDLSNGDKLGVWNSIACFPGGFDLDDSCFYNDCLAENLLTMTSSGAVAGIYNSRVGLGTPAAGMGASEFLSLEFYRKAFRENVYRIGPAHAFSKDEHIPTAQEDEYYWFCIAELTLFGDPVMPMWLDEPINLTVEHPDTVDVGPSQILVTVTDNAGPVPDALVCLMSTPAHVYEYGLTDMAGQVSFNINPTEPGTLWVTTTAENHLPDERYAIIHSIGVEENDDEQNLQFSFTRPQPSILVDNVTLHYAIDEPGTVNIAIYNTLGQNLGTVLSEVQPAGIYSCVWDGMINRTRLARGVYFVRLSTRHHIRVHKILIL